jgi:hypothetical protein
MTTALIILVGCALVLVPTLLFVLLVQPIWAFVEVCGTSLLGRGGKILWLLALLIFTVIGSIPYALFVSASAALRKVTLVCLLLIGVIAGIGYGVIQYNPHLKDQVMRQVNDVRGAYAQVKDISELAKRVQW